jgi:putative ABC transport system permease protein
MRQMFREFRRAPARIVTSVVALALALGAIGVFAIPAVASSSLREAVRADRMANVVLDTTDTGSADVVTPLASVAGVEDVLPQVVIDVGIGDGTLLPVVGRDLSVRDIDAIGLDTGRLPTSDLEVVVGAGLADVGDVIAVTDVSGTVRELSVVGVGGTAFWAGEPVAFTTVDTARLLSGVDGYDSIAVRVSDTSVDGLRTTADLLRDRLAAAGVSSTTLPLTVPGGTHPIEDDISQVSTLIGLLGVVAGLVALVLLGSTTNTLITERTREAAVMRALGARARPLRRRLRRLAVAIAAVAAAIGLPLGVLVSNVIARMVMQEFLGMTPGLAVSVPVLVASAVFALVGATIVSDRAARRVTRIPLATALRDRDGSPFGRRPTERLVARSPIAGLLDRAALRNAVHRRSRSMAIVTQVGVAVAALLVIASLATTVNAFNAAEYEPWVWDTRTTVSGVGLDIAPTAVATLETTGAEAGIETVGEVDGWEVDVVGLEPDTTMLDTTMDDGRWLGVGASDPSDVVVSSGFAEHTGIGLGDLVEVELATGPSTHRVVGFHPLRGRTLFVDRDALAGELGRPGWANVVYGPGDGRTADGFDALGALTTTAPRDAYTSDDSGRAAILLVFGAIGLVVVAVAGLSVSSALAVNVFERRHELAAVRALGGRSRHVLRLVGAELVPLAVIGVVAGVAFGYVGARAIISSFERADAVEIGFTFAGGAVPIVAASAVAGCLAIGALTVRRAGRSSVAATLRSAT